MKGFATASLYAHVPEGLEGTGVCALPPTVINANQTMSKVFPLSIYDLNA